VKPLLNLTTRQLQAVAALAENRSFIAAAASLKISQPALTRIIQQVEATLGMELFSRTTRQVTTTQAGKEFVALAERVLGDLQIAVDGLRARQGEQRGQVTVSSVLLLSEPRLARVAAGFRRQHPGIDLQFREGMLGQVIDEVRSGAADFGIAYVNSLPDAFIVEALGVETLHVVLPLRHALTRKPKVDITDLRAVPMVSYSVDARTRRLVDAMASSAGFSLRHTVTVNRVATLMNMVREGVGLAIVPSSERPMKAERHITSRPLAAAKLSRLGLVRVRERELSPAAASLHAMLKEWIRAVAPRKLRAARRTANI